jgi:putative cell wall-binding protein
VTARSRTVIALLLAAVLGVTGSLVGASAAVASTPTTVSGFVSGAEAPAVGLKGILVYLYQPPSSPTHGTVYKTVGTDASGHYTITGVDPGQYVVGFNTLGEIPTQKHYTEFLGSTNIFEDSPPITVVDGTPLTLDGLLKVAGSISGTITGPGPDPLVYVTEYTLVSGSWVLFNHLADVASPYTIPLPAGDYRIQFNDEGQYAAEYYDNAIDVASATTVHVSAGVDTPNIDAILSVAGPVTTSRLFGVDRFATSVAVSQTYSPFAAGNGVVYLANGLNFPDALSAAPAAAFHDSPLLLTAATVLPANVKTELQRLHPNRIVVVGGTGVVSDAVFAEVAPLAPIVDRVGGVDRYATSRAVTEDAFPANTTAYAFVATGAGFADALSASAAAAHFDAPVILVDGSQSTVPTETADLLGELGASKITIAGGTGVVSTALETALTLLPSTTGGVSRLAGVDRYATSLAINTAVFPHAPTVYFAVGTGYADALAGAALAGTTGSPLYVIPPTCVPLGVLLQLANQSATKAVILGGTGALSSAVDDLVPCG